MQSQANHGIRPRDTANRRDRLLMVTEEQTHAAHSPHPRSAVKNG